jgi:hypothetical protein
MQKEKPAVRQVFLRLLGRSEGNSIANTGAINQSLCLEFY